MTQQGLATTDDQGAALSDPSPTTAAGSHDAVLLVPEQRLRHTFRSELTKITSLRAAWMVPAISGGFITLIVALSMAFSEDPSRASAAKTVIQVFQIPVIALAAFVTSTITSEYGHQTIRVTYTATPRRGRSCAGRYLAVGVYASVALLTIAIVSLAIGTAILWARGAHYTPASPLVVIIGLSVIVGVLTALGGLSLGYLIAQTAAAVTLVAAYIFIEQTMFGLLIDSRWDGLVKWFPFSAAWDAALGTESGPDLPTFGRPWGLLYYAAVVGALAAIAISRELRRDA